MHCHGEPCGRLSRRPAALLRQPHCRRHAYRRRRARRQRPAL